MLNVTRLHTLQELDTLSPTEFERQTKKIICLRLRRLGIDELKGGALEAQTKEVLIRLMRTEMRKPRESADAESLALLAVDSVEANIGDSREVWDGTNAEVAKRYADDLKRLTVEQFNTLERTWYPPSPELWALAAKLSNDIGLLRNGTTGLPLAAESKLGVARDVFREMHLAVERHATGLWTDAQTNLRDNYKRFRETVFGGLKSLADEKVAKDSKTLIERKTALIAIDPENMLRLAKATLETLNENTPKEDWWKVSIALALTTGRRMAEIHSTAKFTQTGDYTVWFTGQAKTKEGRKDVSDTGFEIPTLVPAELVVRGLEWLEGDGLWCKRIDAETQAKDPKSVNKRYSNPLSGACASWFKVTIPSEVYDAELARVAERKTGDGTPGNRFIYHAFRQVYGLCALRSFKPENRESVHYLGDILGHSTDKPSDAATSVRYMSDFVLSPDCITQL